VTDSEPGKGRAPSLWARPITAVIGVLGTTLLFSSSMSCDCGRTPCDLDECAAHEYPQLPDECEDDSVCFEYICWRCTAPLHTYPDFYPGYLDAGAAFPDVCPAITPEEIEGATCGCVDNVCIWYR